MCCRGGGHRLPVREGGLINTQYPLVGRERERVRKKGENTEVGQKGNSERKRKNLNPENDDI